MKTKKCDCDVQSDKSLGHFGDCRLIKQSEHTPTPWAIERETPHIIRLPISGVPVATAAVLRDDMVANAAFIVRAVNAYEGLKKTNDNYTKLAESHEELLDALKLLVDDYGPSQVEFAKELIESLEGAKL